MPTWIALFRGINVGGKNKMSMGTLSDLLEAHGCQNVRTYIQTGNAVFTSSVRSQSKLASTILDAIERDLGFRPHLLILSASELADSIDRNPFPKAVDDPKTLHFFFLASQPENADLAAIANIATDTERHELSGKVFYLHAPDGFGISKLAKAA